MSTFNGCGTHYYGWRHKPDGSSEATQWFVLFLLPIVPLRKHELRVLSDPAAPGSASMGGVPILFPTTTLHDSFQVLARKEIAWDEVLSTYAWSYLVMPVILALPLAVLIPYMQFADKQRTDMYSMIGFVAILLYMILYVPGILAHLLHKSRGAKPVSAKSPGKPRQRRTASGPPTRPRRRPPSEQD